MRVFLSKLPAWLLTILTLLAIFWLTLAPKPLGDEPPALFPGADKIVHALMFGGLVAMMLLDWQRKHYWEKIGWQRVIVSALLSSVLGVVIEFAQVNMDFGRSFEISDMLADTAGAFLIGVIWINIQYLWVERISH